MILIFHFILKEVASFPLTAGASQPGFHLSVPCIYSIVPPRRANSKDMPLPPWRAALAHGMAR